MQPSLKCKCIQPGTVDKRCLRCLTCYKLTHIHPEQDDDFHRSTATSHNREAAATFFFSMTVSSVCPCRPPPLLLGDVPKQVHNMSLSSCVSMLTRKVPPRPFPLRSRHLKPPSPTAAPLRSNCRSAVSARWTRVCSAWLSKCLLMYVG